MRWPFTRYGDRELAVGAVVLGGMVALALWKEPWDAPLPVLLFALLLNFFRDPERATPGGDATVVSPADGRVADIEEAREDDFLHADAVRVGIFMSVLDVHVNRAPLAGRVVFREHRPGKFLSAMGARASRENECSLMGLECPDGTRVLVKQIAGLIARRIVCGCEPGRELARGERFGMVKFGSRVEVYVPTSAGFRVGVRVGDRVRAGRSVLGQIGAGGRST